MWYSIIYDDLFARLIINEFQRKQTVIIWAALSILRVVSKVGLLFSLSRILILLDVSIWFIDYSNICMLCKNISLNDSSIYTLHLCGI